MISVCMPYWNRQELLNVSLAAYRELYPGIEVSIADDGSTPAVVADGCVVTRLPTKDHALNPCVPINAAVNASSGDIIVLTNPEILHTENIFDEMLSSLESDRDYVTASCVGGSGWLAHSSIKPLVNGRGPMPEGSQFHFCAMFYRSLWDAAGGFDEEYRAGQAFDDNDWLWRLEDAGAVFKHRDDLVVRHAHTGTKWPAGGWFTNGVLHEMKWGHKWKMLPSEHEELRAN